MFLYYSPRKTEAINTRTRGKVFIVKKRFGMKKLPPKDFKKDF